MLFTRYIVKSKSQRKAHKTEMFTVMLLLLLSRFSRGRLCATPQMAAHQAPPSLGFSRQEYWSGLPCPPPGDHLGPGIKPASPALAGGSFTTEPPGRPYQFIDPTSSGCQSLTLTLAQGIAVKTSLLTVTGLLLIALNLNFSY